MTLEEHISETRRHIADKNVYKILNLWDFCGNVTHKTILVALITLNEGR